MRQDIYSYTYFHLQLYYTDVVKFGKGIYSLAYLKNVLSKFINKNDIIHSSSTLHNCSVISRNHKQTEIWDYLPQ